VILSELTGPFFTRVILVRAGEITAQGGKEVKRDASGATFRRKRSWLVNLSIG